MATILSRPGKPDLRLYSIPEIARLCGRSESAVWKWKSLHPESFPEPMLSVKTDKKTMAWWEAAQVDQIIETWVSK